MLDLDMPEYTYIAENILPINSWDEYDHYVTHYLHGTGTHAFMRGYLQYEDLMLAPMDKWWKSSESVPGTNSYGSLLSRRDWRMNEVWINP